MVSKGGVINFPNLNQHCVTLATLPVAEGHYCYCDAWIVIWELIFVKAKNDLITYSYIGFTCLKKNGSKR